MIPWRRLFMLLAFTLPGLPAHAALSPADSLYRGYRIPEHRWTQWSAFLDGSTGQRSGTAGLVSESRRGSFDGRLGTSARWGYDSDPLQYGWGFAATVHGARTSERTEFVNLPFTSDYATLDKRLDQRASVSGSVRAYPWRTPVGLTLRSDHLLDLRQDFSSLDRVDRSPPDEFQQAHSRGEGTRSYLGTATVGIGLGRVRDATPVFRAEVAEQRLLRTGALARPLSGVARNKLAALFAVQGSFGFAHQRPDKFFWKELERVLREDGALGPGSLDAFDIFRLLEPIVLPKLVARRIGFHVGPAVQLATHRLRTSLEDARSNRLLSSGTVVSATGTSFDTILTDRRDDVFSMFIAEYHRPFGSRWQTDASTSASLSEGGENLAVTSAASATFIVSDRWLASLFLAHFAAAPGHGTERRVDSWRVSLGGELHYFLEDSWALRLSGGLDQDHSRFGFSRSSGVAIGVTYVVSGMLEAAGLVERMRPTPPVR